MSMILDGFKEALAMIARGDADLWAIIYATLKVCLLSTFISVIIGIPLGMIVGLKDFFGKKVLLIIIHLGMGLPPVVAGLWITMLLWRNGPLGQLELLYTKQAIIIAQVVVSLPIIIGLTASTFQAIDRNMLLLLRSMGATKVQMSFQLMQQTKYGLYAAIIAGLGRVFAEVGAAMMVGGNLQGDTRILTTSIVLEVSKGKFSVALALSFILIAISLLFTILLTILQQRTRVE